MKRGVVYLVGAGPGDPRTSNTERPTSKAQELFVFDVGRSMFDVRLAAVQSGDMDQVRASLIESERIQRRVWDTAVVNARKDMNSDVAALYIESLNELINLHALRLAVGLQTRIPGGIWLVLYILIALGMLGVGYQTAIAGSGRSWATPILALSFSLVIALIIALDRPDSGFIPVSQQPLVDVQAWMATGFETDSGRGE